MFIQLLFSNPLYFLAVLSVIVVSVSLHEMGHAMAAYYIEGDDTAQKQGFLKFNPWIQMGPTSLVFLLFFGICWGLTPVNPSRFRHGRVGESLVAMAGLWVNGLLLLGSLLILMFSPALPRLADGLLQILALKNALLLLLNLLPLPPLDGFAILSPWLPAALKPLENYGPFVLAIVFMLLDGGRWLSEGSELLVTSLWMFLRGLTIM